MQRRDGIEKASGALHVEVLRGELSDDLAHMIRLVEDGAKDGILDPH